MLNFSQRTSNNCIHHNAVLIGYAYAENNAAKEEEEIPHGNLEFVNKLATTDARLTGQERNISYHQFFLCFMYYVLCMMSATNDGSVYWCDVDRRNWNRWEQGNKNAYSEFLRSSMPLEINRKKKQSNEEKRVCVEHRTWQYYTWKRTDKTMKLIDEKRRITKQIGIVYNIRLVGVFNAFPLTFLYLSDFFAFEAYRNSGRSIRWLFSVIYFRIRHKNILSS